MCSGLECSPSEPDGVGSGSSSTTYCVALGTSPTLSGPQSPEIQKRDNVVSVSLGCDIEKVFRTRFGGDPEGVVIVTPGCPF